MALKSTIYKINLSVSDMDRYYFNDFNLTVARHPSETEGRMMIRILAFALHAQEKLCFTRGLFAEEEPEVWVKNYSGDIELWVELGLPDEKRIKKACVQSEEVVLYAYGDRTLNLWWEKNKHYCQRFDHLKVLALSDDMTSQLVTMAQKNMDVQCHIEDHQVWFSDGENRFLVEIEYLKR
ncbi:MAG: YaeQ family protein [Mariprofundaceae bacterium]|nr:YaeQ family protein [Mariprofundaceae bacterium]